MTRKQIFLPDNEKYYAGELQDYACPEEAIAEATRNLPKV